MMCVWRKEEEDVDSGARRAKYKAVKTDAISHVVVDFGAGHMMMMMVVVVYLFSVVKRMRFWCDAVGCLRRDLNDRLHGSVYW